MREAFINEEDYHNHCEINQNKCLHVTPQRLVFNSETRLASLLDRRYRNKRQAQKRIFKTVRDLVSYPNLIPCES